jgi:sugar/nucleoside kinase (ribokinase family)
VGDDFGAGELAVLRTRGTDTRDVEHVTGGETFFWRGEYDRDLNSRRTLETRLNVFAGFMPKLSDASRACDVLFLANIQPQLQRDVRDQCSGAAFVALDSMDMWIGGQREALLDVIRDVDCVILNDGELRQLTGGATVLAAAREVLSWGPSAVVAKQGEYGAVLVTEDSFFAVPAYPVETVVDPTGAGDTFAGGFVGYVARHLERPLPEAVLRLAMVHGTALASFNVEAFGTDRVRSLGAEEVRTRVRDLRDFTHFEPAVREAV